MASTTDIVNRAMRLLKAQRIASLTDGSKNANVANDIFAEVRDELLRAHTWKFATKLVTLARLSTAPTFEFDHAYALPSDWIRTISPHDNDAGAGTVNYREAEIADVGALLASIETAFLNYVYRVTDPNRMDPSFRTALSYELAVQMPGIANVSNAEWERLESGAARHLMRAKSADGLGSTPIQRPRGSWANSRHSRPRDRWPR